MMRRRRGDRRHRDDDRRDQAERPPRRRVGRGGSGSFLFLRHAASVWVERALVREQADAAAVHLFFGVRPSVVHVARRDEVK